MPDVISASIVFPLLNFAWRTVQTSYELAGVPSATSDHLKTISQVLLDIETARRLRNQTVAYLSDDQVKDVDTVIKNTEEALAGLESLVERARVDMQLHHNTVRAPARIMWVMRDSGMANAALSRLSLTSQSLYSQVSMMRQTQRPPDQNTIVHPNMRATLSPSYSDYGVSSPSHLLETTKALSEHRKWVQRRYSVRSGTSTSSHARRSVDNPPPLEENLAFFNVRQNVTDWIRGNESVLSDVDPDVFAGPRSELLHARVVETDDQWTRDYPSGFTELAAESILAPRSQPDQRVVTMPSSSYLTFDGHGPGLSHHVDHPQAIPPAIPDQARTYTPETLRRPPGSNNPFRARGGTPSSTNARSTTTQTPGRRGERLVTWVEPLQEEEEEEEPVSQHSLVQESIPDEPPPYSPVTTPAPPPVTRAVSNAAGLQGRRAARIHNVVYTQTAVQPDIQPIAPLPSGGETTARSGTVRCNRSRPSRSEWALAQHESEAASINRESR